LRRNNQRKNLLKKRLNLRKKLLRNQLRKSLKRNHLMMKLPKRSKNNLRRKKLNQAKSQRLQHLKRRN